MLASASYDGGVRVWDTNEWKTFRQFDAGPSYKQAIAWSPDCKRLAWGSVPGDRSLRIWHRDSDTVQVLANSGYGWMAWSHDGSRLAITSNGKLQILDALSLNVLARAIDYRWKGKLECG